MTWALLSDNGDGCDWQCVGTVDRRRECDKALMGSSLEQPSMAVTRDSDVSGCVMLRCVTVEDLW